MKPTFKEILLGKKEITLQGNIVFPDGAKWGSISFSKGKGIITSVEKGSGGDADHDADLVLEEGYLFPGFVDLHVHAREDHSQQWTYKENYISAAKAALAGGVTAFADMPNTPVPAVDDESYAEKYRLSRYSGMEVLPYAGIGPETKPLETKVPYKVFMAKSIGELCFENEKELREALSRYQGQNVSFHCEDPDVLRENEHKKVHRERRPPEAEARAVELALELIEEFGLRGKLCHISTKGALELIETGKRKSGLNVTVEASPHHLLLEDNGNGIEFPDCLRYVDGGKGRGDDWQIRRGVGDERMEGKKRGTDWQRSGGDTEEGKKRGDDWQRSGGVGDEGMEGAYEGIPEVFFQVNPPIRGHEDRKTLLDAFREGRIDFLATDHAPHTLEEKRKGISGIPHLDCYGNYVGCLMEAGVSPEVIAGSASFGPGGFISEFGLNSRRLEVGEVVHLTYLEREEEEVLGDGGFTKAGWNAFEGRVFPWSVGFTIIRGRGWKKSLPGELGRGNWK